MAIFKCKMCGGNIEIEKSQTVGICEYCGTRQTINKNENVKKIHIEEKTDLKTRNLLERTHIFLQDKEWDKAKEYADKALDNQPKNFKAYFCKYLATINVSDYQELIIRTQRLHQIFSLTSDYNNAVKFADNELYSKLKEFESIRTNTQYENACEHFKNHEYKSAQKDFDKILGYKDSKEKSDKCEIAIKTISENLNKINELKIQNSQLSSKITSNKEIQESLNKKTNSIKEDIYKCYISIKNCRKILYFICLDSRLFNLGVFCFSFKIR